MWAFVRLRRLRGPHVRFEPRQRLFCYCEVAGHPLPSAVHVRPIANGIPVIARTYPGGPRGGGFVSPVFVRARLSALYVLSIGAHDQTGDRIRKA